MRANPIKEWIARVADECGSPAEMLNRSEHIKNSNTRKLIVDYARLWQRKIDLRTPA